MMYELNEYRSKECEIHRRGKLSGVTSAEKKEFDAVVLNQTTINNYDALDKIEMKRAPGHISGTIIADNNKYENYFIILKSEEPHSVQVTTTVEEIPPKESSVDNNNTAFNDVVKSGITFNEEDLLALLQKYDFKPQIYHGLEACD